MLDWSHLGKYRENNRLEAKRAQGGLPHSIWETYSAFANTFGGILLLGVTEGPDKTFSTVPLPDPDQLAADFWNTLSAPGTVNVNILSHHDVQVVESGGNRIVVIQIPRADRHDRPVYMGRDPFTGTYRRSGEGDYRCTPEEVRGMIRDQTDISLDTRVLSGADLDVFCPESVERYRREVESLRPGGGLSELETKAFLHRVGAMARDRRGTLHPTAGGLLMLGWETEIRREFPGYSLDYQEPGEPGTRILSSSGSWSGNLFDFYLQVYERVSRDFSAGSPVRQALREALVNAQTHADYYDRRGLVIQRLPNQIRIANPGAFRVDVREVLAGGVSDPRNAVLIRLFRLIGAGGGQGGLSGIRAVWQSQGWQAPQIVESFGPDRTVLTLPLRPMPSTAGLRQDIVVFLTDAAEASAAEIARGLAVDTQTLLPLLNVMEQDGILSGEGEGPGRHYRLSW